jgi:hypothetical protein
MMLCLSTPWNCKPVNLGCRKTLQFSHPGFIVYIVNYSDQGYPFLRLRSSYE